MFKLRNVGLYREIKGKCGVLPNFMIIGTPAGGTSSLYEYLSAHPFVSRASTKEVHFFDNEVHWRQGINWYKSYFPCCISKFYKTRMAKQDFVTGEASPSYLANPHTAYRAFAITPQAKFIVLLRNPVERAYSYYNFRVRWKKEKKQSFEEAIDMEEKILCEGKAEINDDSHNFGLKYVVKAPYYPYLATGIYIKHLKVWMNVFLKEQFLVLKSEDFFSDTSTYYKKVLHFLDLPIWEPDEYPRLNANKDKVNMDPVTRNRLAGIFEVYNQRLYDYLSVDFNWK